jgi:hypothetical protein
MEMAALDLVFRQESERVRVELREGTQATGDPRRHVGHRPALREPNAARLV